MRRHETPPRRLRDASETPPRRDFDADFRVFDVILDHFLRLCAMLLLTPVLDAIFNVIFVKKRKTSKLKKYVLIYKNIYYS